MRKKIPVLCIVAPGSGYGKTPIIQDLVRGLLKLGIASCVLKHTQQHSDPDSGKDTWLFRLAGSLGSGMINNEGLASFFIPHCSVDKSIAQLKRLNPDIILCEGFKESDYPKILLVREAEEFTILKSLTNVLAVVFDGKPPEGSNLPKIIRNDGKSLTEFVLSFLKAAGAET